MALNLFPLYPESGQSLRFPPRNLTRLTRLTLIPARAQLTRLRPHAGVDCARGQNGVRRVRGVRVGRPARRLCVAEAQVQQCLAIRLETGSDRVLAAHDITDLVVASPRLHRLSQAKEVSGPPTAREAVRALGEALGVSGTAASKWLRAAGIETRRAGRPRKGADVGKINLHVSEVDYAGLRFRAAQRGAGLQVTAAALIVEALEAGREPRDLAGPPARYVTITLPAAVLDQLRVEADRRGLSLTALVAGLAVSAVPE